MQAFLSDANYVKKKTSPKKEVEKEISKTSIHLIPFEQAVGKMILKKSSAQFNFCFWRFFAENLLKRSVLNFFFFRKI